MDLEARIRSWADGMWRPGREQARKEMAAPPPSGTVEERLRRLEDERAIEAVFRYYHACYDGRDLEGAVQCFTEDAIQVNGRGTFIGHESLRKSYEYLVENQKSIIHYGTGLHVSVDDDDPDSGLLTARYLAVWVPYEGNPNFHGGTYVNRMRRVNGKWLIAEQRITYNFQTDFELTPRVLDPGSPTAENPLTAYDLCEERFLNSNPVQS